MDGEVVVVNDKKYKELFWGMRGVGYNFGIVSEMKYRVYDVKELKWSIEIFMFKSERLEEVYKYVNKKFDGKGDLRLLMWGIWFLNLVVDVEKVIGFFSECRKLV